MQLLVSVRSAAEAESALAGGADIIDAKDPARGSLGPVTPGELHQICRRIPSQQPFSVALGDPRTAAEVFQAVSAVPRSGRSTTYVKLGFAGTPESELVLPLLRAAHEAGSGRSIGVIAVAYADAARAGSPPPEILLRTAEEARVRGVLLDTFHKADGNLLSWIEPPRLAALLTRARVAGLLTALAGGLGTQDLPAIRHLAPDIVGFRGAVCVGGREGPLSRERVQFMRRQLGNASSVSIRPPAGRLPDAGETPGVSAILDRQT